MIIGIPKEIKKREYRVASIPTSVAELCRNGHIVYVEKEAGIGSGYLDSEYEKVGAIITDCANVYEKADMIYKVKEILPEEYDYLREGQIVFTYLHSNAYIEMTHTLLEKRIIGIAYEDIVDEDGGFPLLKPMSEIAGKGGFLAALHFAQAVNGGRGILLSRVCGVKTPKVTIIGCGSSGLGAAELAASFGNHVTMLDINHDAMIKAKTILPANVDVLRSNRQNILNCLKETDVLINCILWDKTRKDHLIYREDLSCMKRGAMIIDVACDENGAIETSHPTSHDNPIYYDSGILHYCVDNIPSVFSQTSSVLLSEATLPYALEIANKGHKRALKENKGLRRGLSFYYGKLTLEETAKKYDLEYVSPDTIVDDTF